MNQEQIGVLIAAKLETVSPKTESQNNAKDHTFGNVKVVLHVVCYPSPWLHMHVSYLNLLSPKIQPRGFLSALFVRNTEKL